MSFLQDSAVGDVTRGGQLLIHFLRMLAQVARKFAGAMIICGLLVAVALFFTRNDSYERYLALRHYFAQLQVAVFRNGDSPTVINRRDGTPIETTIGSLTRTPTIVATSEAVLQSGVGCLVVGGGVVVLLFLGLGVFIWRTGTQQRMEKHVRGSWLVELKEFRRLMKAHKLIGDLNVANVPLVKGNETSHVMVTGTSGAGKTNAIYALQRCIRARGERAIVFSASPDFIRGFFREGKDLVLSPFDQRCPSWRLWDDCPNDYDYDMIAAAMIPDPVHLPDPFWNTAARSVVSSLTREMGRRGERDIGRLLELLALVPLSELHAYLKHTEGGAQLDPESEKPALSIRTTAVTYARAFRYIPQGGAPFNIRQWVAAAESDSWVFLHATDSQMASVRPLLSMWLEIFTNALLDLPESRTRRIWLILDELPSLQKIPSLDSFLARARKHGGCGAISFQTISQLRDRYGRDGAQTIAGLCSNWFCMRQPDQETAEWVAKSFGQTEVLEANQGVSYGASEVRDGVSLSNTRKVRPLLLDSEISCLPDLHGYARMPAGLSDGRSLPAVKFHFPYRPIKPIAESFIPRELPRAAPIDAVLEAAAHAHDTADPNVYPEVARNKDSAPEPSPPKRKRSAPKEKAPKPAALVNEAVLTADPCAPVTAPVQTN